MKKRLLSVAFALSLSAGMAHAFQFEVSDDIKGSLDTTVTAGFGIRLVQPNAGMVGDPQFSPVANVFQWSNGDNGNLNFRKGDPFATYLKLTPELLLQLPDRFKFMARGTFLYDFMAAETHRTPLENSAEVQVARNYRLLDLWLSKEFDIAGQTARIRAGNQVVSWGESIFGVGGINQTNALDIQKLLTPGTQLKEAVVPSPMISFATGLGKGVNMEAYYQFTWQRNILPPVGTYFSAGDILGNGKNPLFISAINPNFGGPDAAADPTLSNSIVVPVLDDKKPKNSGQFGVAFHYKPEGTALDLGIYAMNYHEKFPVLNNTLAGPQWTYLENRQLYGVSANFPVGNWAVGFETSYRPKDAVALTGCFAPGQPLDFTSAVPVNCPGWVDERKIQSHLTALLALSPAEHGWFLDLVHADTGNVTFELVDIYYPNLKQNYVSVKDGQVVVQGPSAGYGFWMNGATVPVLGHQGVGVVGTKNSLGYTLDFNVVYDGSIIPGWQVIPGCTFTHSVAGDTPTFFANYLEGAMSTNVYLLFNMNPATWQAGINYANYFGGRGNDHLRQPLGDRDFFGGFVSYNF
jgi:hypothetical protein